MTSPEFLKTNIDILFASFESNNHITQSLPWPIRLSNVS
jgi:hypothetical protein